MQRIKHPVKVMAAGTRVRVLWLSLPFNSWIGWMCPEMVRETEKSFCHDTSQNRDATRRGGVSAALKWMTDEQQNHPQSRHQVNWSHCNNNLLGNLAQVTSRQVEERKLFYN